MQGDVEFQFTWLEDQCCHGHVKANSFLGMFSWYPRRFHFFSFSFAVLVINLDVLYYIFLVLL